MDIIRTSPLQCVGIVTTKNVNDGISQCIFCFLYEDLHDKFFFSFQY